MNEQPNDFDLLRRFARQGDQAAFASLVRRHLDLVYATAFRKVQDQGGAEEVAQNVFAELVKKAWQFAPDDSLPAWLYKTTLLESRHWLRGELRRRRREQTAAELGTTMKSPDEQSPLRALVPLLDEALLSLREKDRTALLLRFYENRSLREVGASLGVGEDTAQKRVAGAVEKVSAYFQRRGFKSATAAATAAALEQTAKAAPAAVAKAVLQATAQLTPPALALGWAGLAARLASLTKVQTAAVCVALAAAPVAWQSDVNQTTREQTRQTQAQLTRAQTELSATQSKIDQLNETSERLAASTATAAKSTQRREERLAKFEAWKAKLRRLLTAADYRWPEESPFVRIPKSALPKIEVRHPVTPPGALKPEAAELLGLTAAETDQIEAALRSHFSAMDNLIDHKVYETNRASHFTVPSSAVASQVWYVPALGDEAQASGTQLKTALENILGGERWPLVQAELESSGIYQLRWVLNLDAGKDQQEAGVWLVNQNGQLLLNFGMASGTSTCTSSGMLLESYASGSNADSEFFGEVGLSDSLTQRMRDWILQQAAARGGKAGTK